MSDARELKERNICPNYSLDFNLKRIFYCQKYVYYEKLTNFRRTVGTGVDPRLGGVAFHRIGKAMMTRKIMIMVMIMMMIMMTMTMTFVGEGRGSFSEDWPINSDDDDNDYESGGGGVGDDSSPQDWHTHRSHSTHKPYRHLPGRSSIGNVLRSTFQLVTLATNLSCWKNPWNISLTGLYASALSQEVQWREQDDLTRKNDDHKYYWKRHSDRLLQNKNKLPSSLE